jgi:hypothetical protein
MPEITNATELKRAIEQLTLQQTNEYPVLKAEVIESSDKLKPINILKDTLLQVVSTPDLSQDLLKATIIYIAGIVIKKIFFGKSANPIMRLIGTIIELVLMNIMQKKSDRNQLEE